MMKNIQPTLLVALVVAGTLGWATPSRADLIATPIFDNTTLVPTPLPNEGQSISSSSFWAQGFRTGADPIALHKVSLILENLNSATRIDVKLYTAAVSGVNLVPGTMVTASPLYSNLPGTRGFADPLVLERGVDDPFTTLAANTDYFIAIEGTMGELKWRTGTSESSVVASKSTAMQPWTAQTSGPQLMMKLEQFEDVAAVPEPGSVLFASLVGGGGLLVQRWRRRKG